MSDIVVGIRLKADGSGFVGEMKLAEAELDRLGAATRKTKSEAERFIDALQDEVQAVGKTRNELLMLRASKLGVADAAVPLINQINRFEQVASRPRTLAEGFQQLQTATVMAGISVYALTQAVMATGAALFESQIKLDKFNALMRAGLGASAQQAAEHLDYVRNTAYRLGLDLNSTAMGYAKLTAAARGTELEGKNTRLVFEGVSTATAAMAMTAAETDGVLLALTQMLSKGRVSAEELTGQLGERMPGALSIASRAMGVSTQELYKMMEQGKLMASDFLPKFASQLKKELGGAAAEASANAQASVNRFYGSLEKLKQSIVGSGLGKNMTAQIELAANSINSLADHIDVATSALKTGAEIAAVYLLVFKGAPLLVAATETALTAVVAQVRMAQLAMAIGLPASQLFWSAMNGGAAGFVASSAASIAAIGALKLAMGGLFAAFVGWEIGTWLRDNFVEARVAGLAFVSVMLKGWEHLKYGANVAWEGIKAGFRGAFAAIGEFYANLYSQIATGLKTIGADGAGSSLQQFADDIRSASANTGDFAAAQAQLKAQLNANLAAIDENIQGLVDYEMGVTGSAKASEKAAAAADHLKKKKKELTDEQKKALEKIAEVKAGLEFEIAQLGRSAREQAIYNSLKQAGVSINSAAGKAIAATAGLLYDEQQAVKRAEQAYQDLMQTLAELRGEGGKYQQSLAREEKQVTDLVEAAQMELQTIGLQKSAVTGLTIARLEAERASWLMFEAEVGVAGAAADEIASIDKKIAGYQRLRDVYQQIEKKTETLETVKRIADGIETTFRDAIKDIVTVGKLDFDNFWKAVAISFKTQLADEIYRLTIGKIVVQVVGSFAGGAANAAGAAATAAGTNPAQQGLGIMSGLQGAWSAYNGGMASMASSFATSGMGQYLGLSTAGQVMGPPTATGAMGWTTTGATMTSAGSSMAAAAGPIAAALAAAYTLAEMNKSGWGRENTGEGLRQILDDWRHRHQHHRRQVVRP
jgi:tape measure domain-containing protein